MMRKLLFAALFLGFTFTVQAQTYFPGTWGDWQNRKPEEVGLNSSKIKAAIQFAQENESSTPRSMEINHYQTFGKEPFGDGIGPFKDRGEQTGIIIKNGFIVAEWGEPFRVDMTHSVTKSFLSSTVGIAYDMGLIKSMDDKVAPYMAPILEMDFILQGNKSDQLGKTKFIDLFTGAHNSTITWNQLLRQTSDWEGTLWGKPDWADRPSKNTDEWLNRELKEPGSFWEYNDTRVNVLALAAMNVLREPLPKVLKVHIMDKIGASPTWRWIGYENSWVVIDGQIMQAVSGGGHWGGGMFISARDQARFGYLTLRDGMWKGEQILSKKWLEMARTPTTANKDYGYMNFFLNKDGKPLPSAPKTAFYHLGAGTNMVYVDPDNDLVIVARWINRDAMDGIVKRVLEAIE
ncbi:MAG: serine hydrolase [Balneolaceae bacterium]